LCCNYGGKGTGCLAQKKYHKYGIFIGQEFLLFENRNIAYHRTPSIAQFYPEALKLGGNEVLLRNFAGRSK
jgi:hypothetical protein